MRFPFSFRSFHSKPHNSNQAKKSSSKKRGKFSTPKGSNLKRLWKSFAAKFSFSFLKKQSETPTSPLKDRISWTAPQSITAPQGPVVTPIPTDPSDPIAPTVAPSELIRIDSAKELDDIVDNLLIKAMENEQEFCYTDSLMMLDSQESSSFVKEGKIELKEGKLAKILKEGGIILIDCDNFKGSVEHLNSLFDDPRLYNGRPIHSDVKIVGVVGKKALENKRYSPAFGSRWKLLSSVSSSPPDQIEGRTSNALSPEILEGEEYSNYETIDLNGVGNFHARLVGGIRCRGEWEAYPGILNNAVSSCKKGVILRNAPWNDSGFRIMLKEIQQKGSFSFNGEEIKLPEDFQILRSDGYSAKEKAQLQTVQLFPSHRKAKPVAQESVFVINSLNYESLFSTNKFEAVGKADRALETGFQECTYRDDEGLLSSKDPIVLRITGNLSTGQWHRLMFNLPENMMIHLDRKVSVPKEYKSLVKSVDEESELLHQERLQTINDLTFDSPASAVIASSDTDYASSLLKKRFPDLEFLDVSSETTLDQLTQVIKFSKKEDGQLSIMMKQGRLLNLIKERKAICIRGLENNPTLAQELESLTRNPPYLLINGEKVKVFAPLIVLRKEDSERKIHAIKADRELLIPCTIKEMLQDIHLNESEDRHISDEQKNKLESFLKSLEQIGSVQGKPIEHSQIRYFYRLLKKEDTLDNISLLKSPFFKDYRDDKESYSYLKLLMKEAFQPASETYTVSIEKWRQILAEVDSPDQIPAHFWSLASGCSNDLLEKTFPNKEWKKLLTSAERDKHGIPLPTRGQMLKLLALMKSQFEALEVGCEECQYLDQFSVHPEFTVTLPHRLQIKRKEARTPEEKWNRRLDKIGVILEEKSALFLQGPPGTGKSYIAKAILEKLKSEKTLTQHGPITIGTTTTESDLISRYEKDETGELKQVEGDVLKWAKDKSNGYKVLVIDEANISKKGFWNFLQGMFDDPPYVMMEGKKIALSKEHKVIFTGNQDHYPGRTKHAIIKSHFATLSFKPQGAQFLKEKILSPQFDALNTSSQEQVAKEKPLDQVEAEQRIFEIRDKIKKIQPDRIFSPRDLEEVAQRAIHYNSPSEETLQDRAVRAAFDVYKGQMTGVQKKAFAEFLKAKFGVHDLLTVDRLEDSTSSKGISKVVDTPSILDRKSVIQKTLDLRQARIGKEGAWNHKNIVGKGQRAMLIEGPPGTGKDTLVAAQLRANGFVDGTESGVLGEKTLGTKKYYHLNAGNLTELKKYLEIAVKEGSVVILSEMNTLPSGYLEGELNDILTGNAAEGFFLFATTNARTLSGRKEMSPALLNRFLLENVDDYTIDELRTILLSRGGKEGVVGEMLHAHEVVTQACKDQKMGFTPTARDLFKFQDKVQKGMTVSDAKEESYQYYSWCLKESTQSAVPETTSAAAVDGSTEAEKQKEKAVVDAMVSFYFPSGWKVEQDASGYIPQGGMIDRKQRIVRLNSDGDPKAQLALQSVYFQIRKQLPDDFKTNAIFDCLALDQAKAQFKERFPGVSLESLLPISTEGVAEKSLSPEEKVISELSAEAKDQFLRNPSSQKSKALLVSFESSLNEVVAEKTDTAAVAEGKSRESRLVPLKSGADATRRSVLHTEAVTKDSLWKVQPAKSLARVEWDNYFTTDRYALTRNCKVVTTKDYLETVPKIDKTNNKKCNRSIISDVKGFENFNRTELILPVTLGQVPNSIVLSFKDGKTVKLDKYLKRKASGVYYLDFTKNKEILGNPADLTSLSFDSYLPAESEQVQAESEQVQAESFLDDDLGSIDLSLWPKLKEQFEKQKVKWGQLSKPEKLSSLGESEKLSSLGELEKWFKENIIYSVTEETKESYNNQIEQHPLWINRFLNIKKGVCAECANAFAILVQDQLGIPTRRVNGYSSEQQQMKELHSWVEVYFEESGWKKFDPTGKYPDPLTQEWLDKRNISSSPPESTGADPTALWGAVGASPGVKREVEDYGYIFDTDDLSTSTNRRTAQLIEDHMESLFDESFYYEESNGDINISPNATSGALNPMRALQGSSMPFDKPIVTQKQVTKTLVIMDTNFLLRKFVPNYLDLIFEKGFTISLFNVHTKSFEVARTKDELKILYTHIKVKEGIRRRKGNPRWWLHLKKFREEDNEIRNKAKMKMTEELSGGIKFLDDIQISPEAYRLQADIIEKTETDIIENTEKGEVYSMYRFAKLMQKDLKKPETLKEGIIAVDYLLHCLKGLKKEYTNQYENGKYGEWLAICAAIQPDDFESLVLKEELSTQSDIQKYKTLKKSSKHDQDFIEKYLDTHRALSPLGEKQGDLTRKT